MEIFDALEGPAEVVEMIRRDEGLLGKIGEELINDRYAVVPLRIPGLAVRQIGDTIVVGRYIPEEQYFDPVMEKRWH